MKMNIEIPANRPISGYLEKIIALISGIPVSLQAKILISFLTVIVLLSAMNGLMALELINFNRKYDAIITNITTANSINGYIKPAIDSEMWDVVAGKKEFANGSQYQIIDGVNNQIKSMMANASSDKSRIKLEVILRTMDTLTQYVDKMGLQMQQGSRVVDNEKVLNDIRGVSAVVEASTQDYMIFEVNQAEVEYTQNKERFSRLGILYLILLPCVVGFSIAAAWLISASIYTPIKKLHDVTTTITRNDLQALMTSHNVDEITELGMSFNIMIGKIRQLLDSKIKEQESLKKAEMKALQAQINPHFLYNTLDTIVWMAQANKTESVIEIVQALSNFFRIGLSRGQDWIPIEQEIEHVRSYLAIQKMRYHDILNYQFDIDEAILSGTILKLTLQPLVENAIYHGIKGKRDGGTIIVRARQAEKNQVVLEIIDDGVGLTPYKLGKIQESLKNGSDVISFSETGFGLENVHKRIQLYYGEQYGLTIESTYRQGTCVTVKIPLLRGSQSLPAEVQE